MSILEEIIANKRIEVASAKAEIGASTLERSAFFQREPLSLAQSLLSGARSGIIAEFKRKSPSRGVINGNADIVSVTTGYAEHGASAISVLTDERFFGGAAADLSLARINDIPILRKDFIIDEYQVLESKSIGADVVLLIAAALTPAEVKHLAKFAASIGLEVLLEVHDESECGHICEDTPMIGVNNRNLRTFNVDIEQSLKLARMIPAEKIRIAESGIRSAEDIQRFREAGFKGFLIGERFMKSPDPTIAFAEFIHSLQLMPPHAEGF